MICAYHLNLICELLMVQVFGTDTDGRGPVDVIGIKI